MKGFTDFHCHLYEIRESLFSEIELGKSKNIQKWISCALTSEEITWHLCLNLPEVEFCAGIHPKHIDNKNTIKIDKLAELANLKKIYAIGEVGLDKSILNIEKQSSILLKQLEVARFYNLPVILHVVKLYYELYRVLTRNFPDLTYIIHGFQGSEEIVDLYHQKLDTVFSIGGRLLTRKNHLEVIRKIVKSNNFVFETDAPFENPFFREKLRLPDLNIIIEYVSKSLSIPKEELYR